MIDILMSTYNGARFLAAQIDSILAQDHTEFRLIIRDDGSTDETVKMVEDYTVRDPRVVFVKDDRGNLGAPHSFMALVEASKSALLMLSDQDDVWLPDKVSRTLCKMNRVLEEHGDNVPLAVFTDLTVVNEHLDVINESFWNYQKLEPLLSRRWQDLLAQNVVTGCTLMLNQAAKKAVLPFQLPEMMHDHWIAANVAKYGKLEFVAEPTVLYRQHSQNAEGARDFGAQYSLSKLSGLSDRFSLYRRAATVFGDTSALDLSFRKLRLNLKRLI